MPQGAQPVLVGKSPSGALLPVNLDVSGNLLVSSGGAVSSGTPTFKSDALESAHIGKASAGTFLGANLSIGNADGWFVALDAAAIPSSGATIAPIMAVYINSNSKNGSGSLFPASPVAVTNGLVLLFSTNTSPYTYTPATGAALAFFSGQVV
jgi:hypothetical protein